LISRPILLALFFLAFVTACAKAPPQTSSSGAGRQAVDPELAEKLGLAVREIAANQSGLDYLSAFAQVSVERGKQRRLFDAVLQVAKPNRLSLQVLNDLGQEIARVVADGETVYFHENESGRSERFAQNSDALRKTLRLPLSIDDLVDRLLLRLPDSPVLQVERELSAAELPPHWITRQDDALRLDGRGPRLSLYESKPAGKSWRYRVDYSDYTRVGGREFPQRIAWSFRKPSLNLTLKLQQIAFQPPASRDVESSFDTKNR
jgi:hypothetical protein